MKENSTNDKKKIDLHEGWKITDVNKLLEFCRTQNKNAYKDLNSKQLSSMIGTLTLNLITNKNNKKDIVVAMQNILNKAPLDLLTVSSVDDLLRSLKDNSIDNVSIDGNRLHGLFVNAKSINLSRYFMLLSYCKDNSVPSDIFDKEIDNKKKMRFTKQCCFRFPSGTKQETKQKFYKYVFTPSLINFLKSKLQFNKDYNLEQVLKNNFGDDNFVEGDNCDFDVILYRLLFESYISVPHRKEDVVKLFKTTKFALPQDYKNFSDNSFGNGVKFNFYSNARFFFDFGSLGEELYKKVYKNMDELVEAIFKEKWTLKEHKDSSGKLTLEDLKILTLSQVEFKSDNNAKGITEQEFLALIPDEIDDKYYFIWLIEFYIERMPAMNRQYFASCIERYKFKDTSDFENFCNYMEIRGKQGTMTNSKVARAILNACSNIKSQLSNSIIFQDLQEVVKEADGENKTNNGTNSNLIVSGTYNANINFGQNDLTNLQTQNENIRTNNNSAWFGYVLLTLMFIGIVLLTIITLGGIFWGPWLFKKIFGNCCNFEGGNVIDGDNENLKDLNQSSIPRQDNNPEENLNNRVIGDDDKNLKNLNQSPIPTQDNNPERKFRY